jgi:predicted membrane-bound spermidine synthase
MNLVSMDPVVADSRRAALLFAVSVALLMAGAALGLNTWPFGAQLLALATGNVIEILFVLDGFALVLAILFWGSRPSAKTQWAALVGWLLVTPAVAHALDGRIPLSWAPGQDGLPVTAFAVSTLGLALLPTFAWRIGQPLTRAADPMLEARLRWMVGLSVLFLAVPLPALSLTATLHPHTFDLFLLHWDRAAGLNFTPELIRAIDAVPVLPQLVETAYRLTPLAFLAVATLQLHGRPRGVPSGILVWVGMTTCALIAYHAMPITGPAYIFGRPGFEAEMADPALRLDMVVAGSNFARNGMPSMHFGWMLAATILWWRSGTKPLSRALLVTMTALTLLATLYLGEHYVVDLIVAVPFVLAGIALATTDLPWSNLARARVVVAGFGTWLVWVMLLRWGIEFLIDRPLLCWLMIAATAAVVVAQARWTRLGLRALAATPPAVALPATSSPLQRRFGAMFFVSGAAALVYQVLFAKELALVFGSTATATFTVLATFLGGMAIGSLIGGTLAHRVRRPLVVYAVIEVGIAVYCVATPKIFDLVQALYVTMAGGVPPDTPALLALRVALGAVVLLVPTVLMGTTLPLLAQALGREGGRMGHRVAWLYFANTAGAAVGALTTTYFVIPAVGARSTTLLAAMLNLLVALGALELAKHALAHKGDSAAPAAADPRDTATVPRAAVVAALLALGLGGVLSLGLEVVYVHLLAVVAGNSVYAFGLMVGTFLIGLALGGEAARRWLVRPGTDPLTSLGVTLLGLAIAVAAGSGLWDAIPAYFASFAGYPAATTFSAREAIRGIVCAGLMLPPTVFIGATYAFAMDLSTAGDDRPKALQLGRAAAVNTAGNILGVLLFGFVLLPALGGLGASQLIAAVALLLGITVLVLGGRWRQRPALAVASVALFAVGLAQRATLDYSALSSGSNVYFAPQGRGDVIDHAESIDGGLTTVTKNKGEDGRPVLTLLTNGKFQGNNAMGGEMQAQIGFAFAPLLHTADRNSALVIGYGTGVTSRVFHEAGFHSVHIAELSDDLVRLADRHFAAVNAGVSRQPGVKMHVTDGRNLLLLTQDRFDVISIEITSIWFAGAASLYNQEFYRLAKSRLQPGGVLQQWVQLHHISPTDVLHVIATLRAEFRHVSLYVLGSQGILVATDDLAKANPHPEALRALEAAPALAELRRVADRPLAQVAKDRLLTPDSVDRYIAGVGIERSVWLSTDNNLRLEYSTPKGNVLDGARSLQVNTELLARFR